jgi:putative ABC transport system permease protein
MSTSMFGYYLNLGVRHLRRNPVLTGLIVLTIAVGVAASMSTLTILHAMSGDPIPSKSDRLFVPLLDIRPDDGGDTEPEPPNMLTYRDTIALRDAGRGARQTAVYGIRPAIDAGRPDLPPFFGDGIAVHADFFAMFEVPFVRGGAWTIADDTRGGHVVVVRESLANQLFGADDPLGKTIRMSERDYVVTGVVSDEWEPLPKFYRLLGTSTYGQFENVFVPFTTAITNELDVHGQLSCYDEKGSGTGFKGLLESECVWVLFWVELASPADAPAYRDFMTGYVADQRKLGRFPLPTNNRLYDVMTWLDVRRVVSNDSRLQTYLAFGFLLVCLVNTIGLLLAKFTARSGEIGVRRALGAGRRAVFAQYMTETAVLGLAGGLVGLGLTRVALWLIGSQSKELAALARMDWVMLLTTFALAVGASLLAGLLPTWRACQVRPAVQLKSQ